MSQELLNRLATDLGNALLESKVDALIVIIPGSGKLYGSATIFSDMNAGCTALGLMPGVTIRQPRPQLGLVTFDYVPATAQV